MKKVFLFLLLLVLLGGCSVGNENLGINKKNADKTVKQNQEDNKINNKQMTENNSKELSNLVKEYNSAILKTNLGDIKIKFYGDASPKTVNNFLSLAQDGFYNGTRFHRIINNFMIQGGDPNSKDLSKKNMWGTGDPGYKFEDEFNNEKLVLGSLAMANSGPNTNGSQFFIVTAESTPWLDGKHTNFGKVVEGMDIVKKIEASEIDSRDCPLEEVVIESIELVK